MEVHTPYRLSPKYHKLFEDTNSAEEEKINVIFDEYVEGFKKPENKYLEKIKLYYDKEVRLADDTVKLIFDFFKAKHLYENTYFIITSDHGEGFAEHTGNLKHSAYFYEENLKVPLIIHSHKLNSKTLEKPVCHLDIAPTILSLAGGERRADFRGMDLLGDLPDKRKIHFETIHDRRGNAYVAENKESKSYYTLGLLDYPYKYIFSSKHNKEELYNITKDEKTNVLDSLNIEESKLAEEYRKETTERLASVKGIPSKNREISDKDKQTDKDEEKVKEKLRQLGYLD